MLGNRNYGFHRDELLHLSVSEHLDWGFMEFPPFIGVLGKLSYWVFDYSLLGVRLFPTLAGVAILLLCCLMAKELGGKSKAVLLAGVAVLAFLPFYRNHTLFQPVAFDQLFWTMGFYFFIKYINTQSDKFLMLMGMTLGLGLMNKYTMLVWGFGMFLGIIFFEKGKLFKHKWLYLSGLLGLIIVLPNIIWQFQNDLPLVRHLQRLRETQLDEINPWEFGLEQLNFPITLALSIIGIIGSFFNKTLKPYKSIIIAAIIMFITMWLQNAKPYYIFAVYPVLFAFGAVQVEQLLAKWSFANYAVALLMLLPVVQYIPYLTPILSIEKFVEYADYQEVEGRVELTGDYADMFGWEEQVQIVDSIYRSLSPSEQKNSVIWAENYGEAGALKILGKKYGLPNPICRHGSFWLYGFQNKNADVWISVANEIPAVEYAFEEFELVKTITHKYAVGEENNIEIYLCKKPKLDIEQWWKDYEPYIFN